MNKLSRETLWSLEEYAEARPAFRAGVLEMKKARRVALHEHAALYFENYATIKYQIQEMLRTERIFEAAGINEELEAYNPLIPDGSNWKATLMFEYPDVEERRKALAAMPLVEHKVWVRIGELEPVYAVANEDLDRSNEEKTSAVHFLRFELDDARRAAAKAGAAVVFGIDHDAMRVEKTVGDATRNSLVKDLS